MEQSLHRCCFFIGPWGWFAKNFCFVQYTPMKCFNNSVQSAVNARKEGDKNPNSSVVAERMKLLANSSYGYQIMDCIQHTVRKCLCDAKPHGFINNQMFKRPGYTNDQLYEVALVKSDTEHKEPIVVGVFILLNAKLRMLELYHKFFDKY